MGPWVLALVRVLIVAGLSTVSCGGKSSGRMRLGRKEWPLVARSSSNRRRRMRWLKRVRLLRGGCCSRCTTSWWTGCPGASCCPISPRPGSNCAKDSQPTWLRRLVMAAGGLLPGDPAARAFFRFFDPLVYAGRQKGAVYPHLKEQFGDSYLYGVDQGALKKISERTGGRAFFPKNEEDLHAAFAQIQEELRSQYVVAYSPTNKAHDGTFRQIKIEVTDPDLRKDNLRLTYRQGYFAKSGADNKQSGTQPKTRRP